MRETFASAPLQSCMQVSSMRFVRESYVCWTQGDYLVHLQCLVLVCFTHPRALPACVGVGKTERMRIHSIDTQ